MQGKYPQLFENTGIENFKDEISCKGGECSAPYVVFVNNYKFKCQIVMSKGNCGANSKEWRIEEPNYIKIEIR